MKTIFTNQEQLSMKSFYKKILLIPFAIIGLCLISLIKHPGSVIGLNFIIYSAILFIIILLVYGYFEQTVTEIKINENTNELCIVIQKQYNGYITYRFFYNIRIEQKIISSRGLSDNREIIIRDDQHTLKISILDKGIGKDHFEMILKELQTYYSSK